MVLYYSHTSQNKIADYIAERLDDESVFINEHDAEKIGELHSEKPFVVIFDCNECTLFELHNKLQLTTFKGSKILYCIFISPPTTKLVKEAAKVFSSSKELVLFGYDIVTVGVNGKLKRNETARLNSQLSQIKNCCPFDSKEQLAFPYSGRAAFSVD